MRRAVPILLAAALLAGCGEAEEAVGEPTVDPVEEAPPVEPAPESSLVVGLEAPDGGGDVGSATLGQVLDEAKTRVAILLTGAEGRDAAVHEGTCEDLGAVAYELEPVVNETSTTTLDASLETVEADLPLAVVVRSGGGELVACGDVVESQQGPGG